MHICSTGFDVQAKDRKRTLSPPQFPLNHSTAHEMVLEEMSPFNTGCGPGLHIDRGASVTPTSFIRMTVDDNGLDGLSVRQLTEFGECVKSQCIYTADTDPFGMLTPSSRAIAGGAEPPPLDLGLGYISVLRLENVGKCGKPTRSNSTDLSDQELTPWRHSDVL